MNTPAPIALFVYNRPYHLKQTLEALQRNEGAKESPLIVYSDAARTEEDAIKVREVRNYVRGVKGFGSLVLVEREKNYGLARSITEGVSEALSQYPSVIVLEDDLVTSPCFFSYMNQGLQLYEKEEKVISIHGYMYPVKARLPETFFLRGADCWGWATWRRGWRLYEPDGTKLLKAFNDNKTLSRDFNFNNTFNFILHLKNQIKGKNDSWAIRWYASAFLADRLTLWPRCSLVRNIGFDQSGTHPGAALYQTEILMEKLNVLPIAVKEDRFARENIANYFRSTRGNWVHKMKKILEKRTLSQRKEQNC